MKSDLMDATQGFKNILEVWIRFWNPTSFDIFYRLGSRIWSFSKIVEQSMENQHPVHLENHSLLRISHQTCYLDHMVLQYLIRLKKIKSVNLWSQGSRPSNSYPLSRITQLHGWKLCHKLKVTLSISISFLVGCPLWYQNKANKYSGTSVNVTHSAIHNWSLMFTASMITLTIWYAISLRVKMNY